jgi:hypothetical protein
VLRQMLSSAGVDAKAGLRLVFRGSRDGFTVRHALTPPQCPPRTQTHPPVRFGAAIPFYCSTHTRRCMRALADLLARQGSVAGRLAPGSVFAAAADREGGGSDAIRGGGRLRALRSGRASVG